MTTCKEFSIQFVIKFIKAFRNYLEEKVMVNKSRPVYTCSWTCNRDRVDCAGPEPFCDGEDVKEETRSSFSGQAELTCLYFLPGPSHLPFPGYPCRKSSATMVLNNFTFSKSIKARCEEKRDIIFQENNFINSITEKIS